MKIIPDKRLFWFLKEDFPLDLTDSSNMDMYVQQVLTRGRTEDVKALLKCIEIELLRESFQRVRPFLPREVKLFWEDFLGNDHQTSKNLTPGL